MYAHCFYNASSWCSCNCWRPNVTPANTNTNGAQLLGRWTSAHTYTRVWTYLRIPRYVCHFDNYDNYKVIKLTHDKTRRVQWECVARSQRKHCTWTQNAYAIAAGTLHASTHTLTYICTYMHWYIVFWNKKSNNNRCYIFGLYLIKCSIASAKLLFQKQQQKQQY